MVTRPTPKTRLQVTGPDEIRRALPSVDRLLSDTECVPWLARWGREPVKRALREVLASERGRLAGPDKPVPLSTPELLALTQRRLGALNRSSLEPVLNGTGVILHTNLGRAPLASAALEALAMAGGYSNLEYDLEAGQRGSRYDHCSALVRELTGADAALVVNNNAAAVALCVNELARDREVVVSRGELVEIGGSFRIPDVVERAGARLVEVGTTNRTRLEDYAAGIGEATGALLKVHPSNYSLQGFVSSVETASLVELGAERGVPVVYDVGSGLLDPGLLPGFPPEPTVRGAIDAGVDLVTWSGDKILGGPQAGLIAGTEEAVRRLRRNPLLRAFRVDKLTLAALEATLHLYRDPELAAVRVPALAMLRETAESVAVRARQAATALEGLEGASVEAAPMEALVGGGSFPGLTLDSAGLVIRSGDTEALEIACRRASPPLIGRIEGGAFLLDFRTLPADLVDRVVEILRAALERPVA